MLQSLLPGPVETVLAVAVGWALTYLVHSTLALGVAWLADNRTPWTRAPRARSILWVGAVAASLLSASLQVATGLGPRVELTASQAEKAVVELRGSAPADAALAASNRAGPLSPVVHRPHTADRLDPAAWYRSLSHDWPFLLVTLWGLGAAVLLVRGAAGARRLRSALAAREPVGSGPGRRALEAAASEADLADGVRLSRCPDLDGPVALPGREICVPARLLRELEEDQLRAVLAHETAHLARGDTTVLLVLEAARRALFFQPLLRLARRRFEEAAEAASDEWVRRLGLGVPLADGLLAVSRWMRDERRPFRPAGLARTSTLERRVRRLLSSDPTGPAAWSRGRAPLLATVGVLGAALLVAAPSARVPLSAHDTTTAGVAPDRPLGAEVLVTGPAEGPARIVDFLGAPADSEARLGELLDGEEASLLVELGAVGGASSIVLRPGGDRIRLVAPDGRTRRFAVPPRPDDGGSIVAVRVRRPVEGRWELHLPPRIRHIGLRVGGRWLRIGPDLGPADLPDPIAPF